LQFIQTGGKSFYEIDNFF